MISSTERVSHTANGMDRKGRIGLLFAETHLHVREKHRDAG